MQTYREINDRILASLTMPGRGYWRWIALCLTGVLTGAGCWAYQIATGLGAAGINHPIIRDRATGLRRRIYGFFALGWTGSHRQWNHYRWAYLLFAALATPLVISVHSVVSWDFALGVAPGWHSTIFAPYFVAGAIHSGLAMVLTLLIPLRRIYRYEDIISMRILDNVAKTIVFTGLIVGYSYLTEAFIAWYSGNAAERGIYHWRAVGHYAPLFWLMVICNTVAPLAFYWKRVRASIPALFCISILINIGMWFERFVIIISSPGHEFDPYSWSIYQGPTWVEYGILLGSFSLFFLLFLLFARFLPTVSMTELKEDLAPPRRGSAAALPASAFPDGGSHG